MQYCIDNIKSNIKKFISGLQSAATINYRLALVAYRNIHDDHIYSNTKIKASDEPWLLRDFTSDLNEFSSWLNHPDAQAYGGGEEPESTLDALYLAIHRKSWRDKAHRVIVLFTDSDCYPTLHNKTYSRPDNGVSRIKQEFETLKHGMLYMVVPRCKTYEILEKSAHSANRKVFATYVKDDDRGLQSVDFSALLTAIGSNVSSTTLGLCK